MSIYFEMISKYFKFNLAGVSHADQNLYFFPVRETSFPTTLPTKEDEEMRKALILMWIDFAKTG